MHAVATFRADDEQALVQASLACLACLSGDVESELELDEFDGKVRCRCRQCGYGFVLRLTPDQTLRLSLEPGVTAAGRVQ